MLYSIFLNCICGVMVDMLLKQRYGFVSTLGAQIILFHFCQYHLIKWQCQVNHNLYSVSWSNLSSFFKIVLMILNLQAFNCCSTSSVHQQCSKPCFSGNVWDRKSKLTTIGKKIFFSRSDSKSVTTDCHMAETEINGIHVRVIDSPSLMIKLDHIISSCFKNKNSQKTRKNKSMHLSRA